MAVRDDMIAELRRFTLTYLLGLMKRKRPPHNARPKPMKAKMDEP
jgi:hypothetical protein